MMGLYRIVRIAFRALWANKMRAFLTMLGIIIGVGAVIGLLSIGQGAQAAVADQIRGFGSNLILVMPGSVSETSTMLASLSGASTLSTEDAAAIADPANCPDVLAVAPEFMSNAQVVYRGESVNTLVSGTTDDYPFVNNTYTSDGGFFDDHHVKTSARLAVLGYRAASDLFGDLSPVGQTIKINRVPFRVIGVMEERGGAEMGGAIRDSRVFVPISTAQTKLFGSRAVSGGGRSVSMIGVSAVDEDRIEEAIEQITLLLRERHDISYQDEDFSVISQKGVLGIMGQISGIFTFLLGAIAAISLLVGGIGIMNIMLVSVTERTREIGLRKAVGADWTDILMQFLAEAVILGVVGGLLGVLFGLGVAAVSNELSKPLKIALVSPQSVLLAVSFSIGVGLFFGIYPATRAAALNPIDALRYE